MKLLTWNAFSELNYKSYHVVKEKRIIYDAVLKTRHEMNSMIFVFCTMFRVNETRVGKNGRKRHMKILKVEFRFVLPPIF